MLKLDAYNMGQLNASLNILNQAKGKGIDIDATIAQVANAINEAVQKAGRVSPAASKTVCKYCGKSMRYCSIIGGHYCVCGYSQRESN